MKYVCMLTFLFICSTHANDKIDKLENRYVEKANELKLSNNKNVKNLNDQYIKNSRQLANSYIKALEREQAAIVKTGNLKAALKIKTKISEIKEVLQNKPLLFKLPAKPLYKPTDNVTLRKYLVNTTWAWGVDQEPYAFMEGSKVQNDVWDKQKIFASWHVTSINSVLITRIKPNGLVETTTLVFHHNRKSFLGKTFHDSTGSNGTRIQAKKERSNTLQLKSLLSFRIYDWSNRTRCLFHPRGILNGSDANGQFQQFKFLGYWKIVNKEIIITARDGKITHKLHFSDDLSWFRMEKDGKKLGSQYAYKKIMILGGK